MTEADNRKRRVHSHDVDPEVDNAPRKSLNTVTAELRLLLIAQARITLGTVPSPEIDEDQTQARNEGYASIKSGKRRQ